MTTEPILFTSRADLIDALEARRSWARALDQTVLAKHKEAEKAALDEFRARCRDLAKKSYADLKALAAESYPAVRAEFRAPSCPVSQEARLDAVLRTLALTKQEKFTVAKDSGWSTAHFLLTHDESRQEAMC